MRVDLYRRDGKVLGQLLLADGVSVHDINLASIASSLVAVEAVDDLATTDKKDPKKASK